MNLYAQVCQHRNFSACKFFSEVFSLNVLLKYAMAPKFDEEMRAEIFKLIRNLYIDQEPYTYNFKPNLVRVVDAARFLDRKKTIVIEQQLSSRNQNQTVLDYSGEPIGGLLTGHILLPKKKRMFLFDDASVIGDEKLQGELEEIIDDFKETLLKFLERKQEQLNQSASSEIVYNRLTLEIIKVLHMLLKFGLF